MLESLCLSLCFFVVTVIVHIVISRVSSTEKFMLKGLLLGGVSVLILLGLGVKNQKIDILALYLLGTGWLAYLMFFINLLNSVTLKMLEALAGAVSESLPSSDFNRFFSKDEGLNSRFDSLEKNKFIIYHDKKIVLTPKSNFMVFVISILKKLFSMNSSTGAR